MTDALEHNSKMYPKCCFVECLVSCWIYISRAEQHFAKKLCTERRSQKIFLSKTHCHIRSLDALLDTSLSSVYFHTTLLVWIIFSFCYTFDTSCYFALLSLSFSPTQTLALLYTCANFFSHHDYTTLAQVSVSSRGKPVLLCNGFIFNLNKKHDHVKCWLLEDDLLTLPWIISNAAFAFVFSLSLFLHFVPDDIISLSLSLHLRLSRSL